VASHRDASGPCVTQTLCNLLIGSILGADRSALAAHRSFQTTVPDRLIPAIVCALRTHGAATGSEASRELVFMTAMSLHDLWNDRWGLDGYDYHNDFADAAACCGAGDAACQALWAHLSAVDEGWFNDVRTHPMDEISGCIRVIMACIATTTCSFVASQPPHGHRAQTTPAILAAACSPEGRYLESLSYLLSHNLCQIEPVETAAHAVFFLLRSGVFAADDGPVAAVSAGSPPCIFGGGVMRRRCREVGLGAAVAAAVARFPNMHMPTGSQCTLEELALLVSSLLGATPGGEGPLRPLPTPPTATAAPVPSAGRGGGGAARPHSSCHHCGKVAGAGNPSFQVCSGCKAVRYCGEECRLAGWKAGHKAECKKASAAAGSTAEGRGGSSSKKQQPQGKKAARK
jgi:hypothetical protein